MVHYHNRYIVEDIALLTTRAGRNFGKKLYKALLKIKKEREPDSEQIIKLIDTEVTDFADGETKVGIPESIRKFETYVVDMPQNKALGRSVNENLIEMFHTLDAARDSLPRKKDLILVSPYFAYCRQDVRQGRECCSSRMLAEFLKLYINNLIALDMHDRHIRELYQTKDTRAEAPHATPILLGYIREKYDLNNLVIVSPDAGGGKRAEYFADKLHVEAAIASKTRSYSIPNKTEVIKFSGDIEGKDCIIVDDMVDTGGTLEKAIVSTKEKNARRISAAVAHPILSDDPKKKKTTAERFRDLHNNKYLDELISTDTIEHSKEYLEENKSWLTIVSVAELIAKIIYTINHDDSINEFYEN